MGLPSLCRQERGGRHQQAHSARRGDGAALFVSFLIWQILISAFALSVSDKSLCSACLSVCLCFCLPLSLTMLRLFVCLFVRLCICPPICLSVRLSACLLPFCQACAHICTPGRSSSLCQGSACQSGHIFPTFLILICCILPVKNRGKLIVHISWETPKFLL